MKLYSLYDTKAGIFSPPYQVQNDALAVRAILEMFDDQRSAGIAPVKYPQDFTLFCLGEFDEASGKITSEQRSIENLLVLLTTWKNQKEALLSKMESVDNGK